MLSIIVTGDEFFNEETSEFYTVGDITLNFEHSLVSVSKWESKYQVPFLSNRNKSYEEAYYYLECMLLNEVDSKVLSQLKEQELNKIQEYIESTQSATTFAELPSRRGPGEIITSELIYYWLVAFNIPFECENWHLNRLFSLIRICNTKQNGKQKKMSAREIAERNRSLNAARRQQLGTSG